MTFEDFFLIFFVSAILAIPFFTGRGLWRAIDLKRRIEQEAVAVEYADARVVGFTQLNRLSDDWESHRYLIVEYKTHWREVIWAETQPFSEGDYDLHAAVKIMYRPNRPRDVMLMPDQKSAKIFFTLEKYFLFALVAVATVFVFGVALQYHGLDPIILGPLALAYGAGYLWAHMTKDRDTSGKRSAELRDQARQERLEAAQRAGVVPCHLQE